jgi:hypothetical protein
MDWISYLFNPPSGLTLTEILIIGFILGVLHGATPDEHTWPITFSYAVGKYSTRGGIKAGFLFSLGFTLQRAFLTTLGYIGLASFYNYYNLDGPVYIIVGIVMAIAGSYILKGKYLHLPFDKLLKGHEHHTAMAERKKLHEENEREVPIKMTIVHGLIAGFGFGAYATIITFVLSPQLPSIFFAPILGLMFGLGTMLMQIIFGGLFGSLLRFNKLSEEDIKCLGQKTAANVLYYGGYAFILVGVLVILLPNIDSWGISTGLAIPNLDALNIGFLMVVLTVGVIATISMIKIYNEQCKLRKMVQSNQTKR